MIQALLHDFPFYYRVVHFLGVTLYISRCWGDCQTVTSMSVTLPHSHKQNTKRLSHLSLVCQVPFMASLDVHHHLSPHLPPYPIAWGSALPWKAWTLGQAALVSFWTLLLILGVTLGELSNLWEPQFPIHKMGRTVPEWVFWSPIPTCVLWPRGFPTPPASDAPTPSGHPTIQLSSPQFWHYVHRYSIDFQRPRTQSYKTAP